jgi:hypothetical protein
MEERPIQELTIHKNRLERVGVDLTRYQKRTFKVNEKGRPPASEKEMLADKCAKITKTRVGRWMRYSENAMRRAIGEYESDGIPESIKNPAAWFTWLVSKKYA